MSTLLLAASAQAQVNPELGDVGASGGAELGGSAEAAGSAEGGWTPPPAPSAAAPAEVDSVDAPPSPGGSDHASVVGALGIGFFGVMDIPILGCNANSACPVPSAGSVSAPTIGARYWLDEAFAVQAGLGLAIDSASFEETGGPAGPVPIDANGDGAGDIDPSILAFAIHGGVPLVLAHSGHFAFEVVPFLNLGIASGTIEPAMGPQTSLSGFLLELGGRVGAEIHFGFIDIPQLALMGSLGLSVRLESRSGELDGAPTKIEQSSTRIGTDVGDDPWDIFTGGITAIYYFGG
ncbi:MAG: hypothetical protein OXT09_34510, partial [Myxococcales bacterium]|nr:hypothetical protein [Myxococcales bacterium]